MTGRDTTPGIAKTLAEVVVVVAQEVDPGIASSETALVAVAAVLEVAAADVARSATNATKWDTLHVIARRIWTGATAVTVSFYSFIASPSFHAVWQTHVYDRVYKSTPMQPIYRIEPCSKRRKVRWRSVLHCFTFSEIGIIVRSILAASPCSRVKYGSGRQPGRGT